MKPRNPVTKWFCGYMMVTQSFGESFTMCQVPWLRGYVVTWLHGPKNFPCPLFKKGHQVVLLLTLTELAGLRQRSFLGVCSDESSNQSGSSLIWLLFHHRRLLMKFLPPANSRLLKPNKLHDRAGSKKDYETDSLTFYY